jgi:succinoglycan biosynthesis transport protein ExoP
MTSNSPPWERSSQIWRFDTAPITNLDEGPIALLRSVIGLVFRHKVKLILSTTIGVVLASSYASSLPRTYTATATLLLEPRRQVPVSGQEAGGVQGLDLNRADSELQIIRSERLLTAVFDSLDLQRIPELGPQSPSAIDRWIASVRGVLDDQMPDKIARSTEISAHNGPKPENDVRQAAFLNFTKHLASRRVGQSYVIEIDYSSSDPTLTAKVANAIVSGYILQSVAFKAQMAQAGTEALQWRLDALAAQVVAATDAMKSGTLPVIVTPDADARVIGAALPPLSPSGPRSSLMIALGGILGLLVGVASLALNLALDRKVRGVREFVHDTGITCLGSLPEAEPRSILRWRGGRRKRSLLMRQPHNQHAVAVRDLRASIEIACSSVRSEQSSVVAIASCEAGRGAATLCLSLAQLISRGGRHVTLFTTNEDGPDSTAIAPDSYMATTLADALIANLRPEHVVFKAKDDDGFSIFPIYSKNADSNFFADFRDRRVAHILDAARAKGDVLLDLPPLSTSTDALALATHADAVVIVATAGKTTTDEVVDTLQRLRRAGANVIGTVINSTRGSSF